MIELFQTMARYHHWMNKKLMTACGTLDDKARKHDRGMFFGSIHSTLNHILWADGLLLMRLSGRSVDIKGLGNDLYEDFQDLCDAREEMDRDIIEFMGKLTEEFLAGSFEWKSQIDGKMRTTPYWLLTQHLFNHATHHRGQVTDALSQLGVDYGVTDLPRMEGL